VHLATDPAATCKPPASDPATPPIPTPIDPPHGRDPRYWLDLDKIKYVPDGQPVPYGYTQIGAGLYYPYQDNTLSVQPPPRPANHPLDIASMMYFPPGSGKLPPDGYKELTDQSRTIPPPTA